jgi:hypothetical protein
MQIILSSLNEITSADCGGTFFGDMPGSFIFRFSINSSSVAGEKKDILGVAK